MSESIGPLRPPTETYSLLVRATVGCPWNQCEFCPAFKGQKFKIRPVEDVKKDIQAAGRTLEELSMWAKAAGFSLIEAARYNGILWIHDEGVKSVFIQDADSLVMNTDSLIEIIDFLVQSFPGLKRITTYARGKTLFKKKAEDLKRLRQAGLDRLHMGLETGDDELLSIMRKGATSDEMIQAAQKAVEAGFELSSYIMPGLGGREKSKQHAINTARVLNQINPRFIRLRTFHVPDGAPIYDKALKGYFEVQSIKGVLKEIRLLVENLEVTSELITGDHVYNYFLNEVDAKLPEEKTKLLDSIDESLKFWEQQGEPVRNPFRGSLNRYHS